MVYHRVLNIFPVVFFFWGQYGRLQSLDVLLISLRWLNNAPWDASAGWQLGGNEVSRGTLQFSCSVMSNSLRPYGLQHTRLPCPSPTPGVAQSHVHRVSDAIQPFHPLLSPSFAFNLPQHQGLFQWVSWSIGASASASASVLTMSIQDWFPLGLTGWISLQSKGLSRVFSNTTVQKHQFFRCSAFFMVQLLHPYMTPGETIALTRWTFVSKVMSLLFNMQSRLVIAFIPGSKCLLISWLQPLSVVILEPQKIKSLTVSIVSPSICLMGPWSLVF